MRHLISNRFLLLISFIFSATKSLQAQSLAEEDLKKAEQLVKIYNYSAAREIYRKYGPELKPPERYAYAICLMNAPYRSAADLEEALRQLKQASDSGDQRAMLWLAEIYLAGQLTTPDTNEAVKLLSTLCANDNPKAMYLYGMILNEGKWVTRDTADACRWMARAAEKKYRQALSTIGHWHYSGSGAPRDRRKAEAYWKQAADLGDYDAGFNHALLQLENQTDTAYALKQLGWYGVNNHVPSLALLARIYEKGLYKMGRDTVKALNYHQRVISTDDAQRKYPEAYNSSLAYVRKEGSVEPSSNSNALRSSLDQLASRIRQTGSGSGAKTTGEQVRKLSDVYKSLEALGFRSGRIIQRLKGDVKTDSAWLHTPYHIYELKIVHTTEEDVAASVFLRWNRILQKTYPEYNMEGDIRKSSLITLLPEQEKFGMILENDGDEVLLKFIYYKNAQF